jgi:hypothetical protein
VFGSGMNQETFTFSEEALGGGRGAKEAARVGARGF